jgi:hypothetical protein
VRTQLGGPPTVARFKVLILRLQPRAETVRPEGVRLRHGIVYEKLPFREGLGQAVPGTVLKPPAYDPQELRDQVAH